MQSRWEHLVGRLCARLAWRKVRMMLHWLHNMLAFSGGTTGGRLGWLEEQIVEVGGQEEQEVWTFRQCTHHLAALLLQLRDPRGLPLLHHLQPCTATDMLAWCRSEASHTGQALDDCAGCLVELSNAGKEAAALGRVPKSAGNVVADVVQQMPPHVVRVFSRRSLCRATCLMAGCAASHELRGNKPPMPELADVAAYKHCEVLLHGGLLKKPDAGVAAFIHDSLIDHLAHLIRTPQVSAALDARCSDVVLSGIVSRMYKQVLVDCTSAGPERRPASFYNPELCHEQVHNAAALHNFRMPLVLT
ncbi:hypothetical protein DUNSADRAFT_6679 [Dunaliella salina]|uniref:Uncharacterized protein n=1 Tax=Dunaliella salina TaxID=3046 RepID=A0ABQ7GMT7_DUNSA|nr:hypothetical protein DUNSADRAFT_6679 [Dunaliella salina]|eukprot:KAF5835922.1 hypothetical protein DUNSADRAFT_6679 [Dunaliella salina]